MTVEEPPPPAEAAAARVGITYSHLRKLFPDLWRELVTRHATYKKDENARRRDAFRAEVRRIAQELLNAGKYPSRRKVGMLLTETKLKGAHLIVREVKKVLDDFSARTVPSCGPGTVNLTGAISHLLEP